MESSVQEAETSTFVFADLAGFTALTEAHGDVPASEIAAEFVAGVRRILGRYDAEEVKTIGDEVMIRSEDPRTAVSLGTEIAGELAYHGSPPVRVGMHSGPAVRRDGDWFGSTVNLASRVADVAKPGEVLLTDATRLELGDAVEVEERGRRYLKHIPELVPVYAVAANESHDVDLEIDPVCRMSVARHRAESSTRRRGLTYYFCSAECHRRFEENPRRYVALSPGARAARRGFLINLAAFTAIGGAHLIAWAMRDFSSPSVGMLILYCAWAVALGVHYRIVREVV